MVKNVKYFAIFIILFMTLSLNVEAAGSCIYNATHDQIGSNEANREGLSIMIKIGENENMFHYANKFITDPNSSEWIDAVGSAPRLILERPTSSDTFVSGNKWRVCPKYLHFGETVGDDDGDTYLLFSNSDTVSGDDHVRYQVRVEEGSDGEVVSSNACANTTDWIEAPKGTHEELVKAKEGYCLYAGSANGSASGTDCFKVEVHYVVGAPDQFEIWAQSPEGTKMEVETGLADWFSKNGCTYFLGAGNAGAASTEKFIEIAYTSYNDHKYMINGKAVDLHVVTRIKTIGGMEVEDVIVDKVIKKYSNCGELLGEKLQNIIKNIINVSRILIPILLKVFGIIDFGSAIFAGDEEKMKTAQKKFITRLIIGVVIFLIPSLLKLILNVAHGIWPVVDNTVCGVLD